MSGRARHFVGSVIVDSTAARVSTAPFKNRSYSPRGVAPNGGRDSTDTFNFFADTNKRRKVEETKVDNGGSSKEPPTLNGDEDPTGNTPRRTNGSSLSDADNFTIGKAQLRELERSIEAMHADDDNDKVDDHDDHDDHEDLEVDEDTEESDDANDADDADETDETESDDLVYDDSDVSDDSDSNDCDRHRRPFDTDMFLSQNINNVIYHLGNLDAKVDHLQDMFNAAHRHRFVAKKSICDKLPAVASVVAAVTSGLMCYFTFALQHHALTN